MSFQFITICKLCPKQPEHGDFSGFFKLSY